MESSSEVIKLNRYRKLGTSEIEVLTWYSEASVSYSWQQSNAAN